MIIDGKKIKVMEAKGFFQKLKGLMFQKNINYVLKIKCNGIHTFFMKEDINVILTDKNNNIIKIIYNLKPNRIILPIKNVYYTYEVPKDLLDQKSSINFEL